MLFDGLLIAYVRFAGHLPIDYPLEDLAGLIEQSQPDLILEERAEWGLLEVPSLPEVGNYAASYTLYDIEELQGFVAAEANHTNDVRLARDLSTLHERLQREMEKYDDGNWQSAG